MAEKFLPCPQPGCIHKTTHEAMSIHLICQHGVALEIFTLKAAEAYLKAKKEVKA